MKKLLLAALLLSGLVMYYSCTKDHASIPIVPSGCDSLVTYNLRVKNILNTYCVSQGAYGGQCHDQNSHSESTVTFQYIYLYDSAQAASVFTNTQVNAMCYVEQSCQPVMPYLGDGPLPDSTQTVPADTINVLKCWISNGCR